MKLFENFNKPIRLRKKYSDKTIVRLHRKVAIYDETSHNVVYLFSIYDEVSHNVVYSFSTPNLGNYQADMTIALNQSKLQKYFQYNNRHTTTVRNTINHQIQYTKLEFFSYHLYMYFINGDAVMQNLPSFLPSDLK